MYIYGMDKKYVVYTISYQGVVKYVGKTCNIKDRWYRHLHCRGNRASAIPVGINLSLIDFNIIKEFFNEEEALEFEDELIQKFNTIDNGWNKLRSGLIWVKDMDGIHKLYRKEHSEKNKVYMAIYNEKHKAEKLAYMKEYYKRKKAEKKFPA